MCRGSAARCTGGCGGPIHCPSLRAVGVLRRSRRCGHRPAELRRAGDSTVVLCVPRCRAHGSARISAIPAGSGPLLGSSRISSSTPGPQRDRSASGRHSAYEDSRTVSEDHLRDSVDYQTSERQRSSDPFVPERELAPDTRPCPVLPISGDSNRSRARIVSTHQSTASRRE